MKSEHLAGARWRGIDPSLRRYTIASPVDGPRMVGPSQDVGMVHTARASLLVRLGGGHLVAERSEVLRRLLEASKQRLGHTSATPSEYIDGFIAWLEHEWNDGFLVRGYITLTLMVAVGDGEVWTWHAGPIGILRRSAEGMLHLVSTDVRIPALKAIGIEFSERFDEGSLLMEKSESIFCIGAPLGYERIRMTLDAHELVWALERGAFPHGPWPAGGLLADRAWGLGGGWEHGIPGEGVVMGRGAFQRSDIPPDWVLREVPFG